MFITDLSIRRPVVSAVFSMILVIFGLFVFFKLPVRELPSNLQPPVVQVQVDYQGASAEIISSEIVEILEDVIGGAEGIKNIDSTSENGRGTIKIEFDTSIDLDAAANDIRDRVSRVSDNLPEDSKAPEILKQSAGFYLFDELPTIYTLSGAGLIVVSSAIIFVREHQLKKPITLPRQQ